MASEDPVRQRWAGGTAVITGAGGGIGGGMARTAAALGMSVVLADVDAGRIETLAAELAGSGVRAAAVQTDVTSYASVEHLADVAFDDVGDVRLVANNAGIEHVSLLWESPPAEWERLISVNLSGVYHGVRAFVPRLISAGRPATIVNTASIASFTSGAYQGMYQISKRAVLALSESLAADLETVHAPIQVSVAFPGAVDTPIFVRANEDGGPNAGTMMQTLRDLLADQGMDADRAGALILHEAGRGQRWISTHPGTAAAFARSALDRLGEIVAEVEAAVEVDQPGKA
ncbi:MAG TPA: SDR family NAD(P)-dependent oxidoreductase [Acidimicrobiales bacterium]|nr:SDR family NAD(P)-dependent oxidoreductase [Acidimicrobiales bacterium]